MDEAELELWYAAEKEKLLNTYMEHSFENPDAEKSYKEQTRALRQEYSKRFEQVLHERRYPPQSMGDKLRGLLWKR